MLSKKRMLQFKGWYRLTNNSTVIFVLHLGRFFVGGSTLCQIGTGSETRQLYVAFTPWGKLNNYMYTRYVVNPMSPAYGS